MSNKELNVSLQEFSLNWESYVENYKRSNYSAPRYYPISLNKENMLKIEPVSYNISFKLVEDKHG
mgnify:CR=1 FL=1